MPVEVRITPRGRRDISRQQRLGLRLAGDLMVGLITPEVPIDTGTLRRSAMVGGKRVPNPDDKDLEIYIS